MKTAYLLPLDCGASPDACSGIARFCEVSDPEGAVRFARLLLEARWVVGVEDGPSPCLRDIRRMTSAHCAAGAWHDAS